MVTRAQAHSTLDNTQVLENLRGEGGRERRPQTGGGQGQKPPFFPAQAGLSDDPPGGDSLPGVLTQELLHALQDELSHIASELERAADADNELGLSEECHSAGTCMYSASEVYYLLERLNACVRVVQVHHSVYVVRGAEPAWTRGELLPSRGRAADPVRVSVSTPLQARTSRPHPPQQRGTSDGVPKNLPETDARLRPSRSLVTAKDLDEDFDMAWDAGAFERCEDEI